MGGTTIRVTALTALLVAGLASGVLAHKGKLPEDALTLVRQASALLAQNPAMTAEVKERLEAALKSKRPQGVDLPAVSAALRDLNAKDIAGARRLLLAAITPAGMPTPPQGVRRAPVPAEPPSASRVPAAPVQLAPPPRDVVVSLGEPLQVGFAGSTAETVILSVALALIGAGLTLLRRSPGEAQQ
jgi:hypothetical protein